MGSETVDYNTTQMIAEYKRLYLTYSQGVQREQLEILAISLSIPLVLFLVFYLFNPHVVRTYNSLWFKLNRRRRIRGERRGDEGTLFAGIVLGLTILAALSYFGYSYLSEYGKEPFSTMLLLNGQGTLGDYPYFLARGQNASIYIYIENHEGKPMLYEVVAQLINGSFNSTLEVRYALVDQNGEWKIPLNFSVGEPGDYKLRVSLYRYDLAEDKFLYSNVFTQIPLKVG
jgi:uncharacterized membrane protein